MIRHKSNGQLIVISAPMGAGKGSVIKGIMENNSDTRWVSVSATSRSPRPGEVDGVNYYYLSRDEFEQKIKEDYFLEYTEHSGNYYGTPKEYINEKLANGIDVILEIETEGAKRVKELYPDVLLIFILPPSIKELVRRLKKRGTESDDVIIKRFSKAYIEINEIPKYNYVVVNDVLEDAIKKVEAILISEKLRVDRIEDIYAENKEEVIHEFLMDKEFDNSEFRV